jgi:hypothetical protein
LDRFNLPVTAPADIDGLSLKALRALVVQVLSKSADQDRLIAERREENARLKGLNHRPRIKPSGKENATARLTLQRLRDVCGAGHGPECPRRPIMMTTMCAILGGLPLMLAGGTGSELRQPLGFAMLGGLLLSHALTLFTTPVVYLYLDRLSHWHRPKEAGATSIIET